MVASRFPEIPREICELEEKVEMLLNGAVQFLMDRPDYDLHIKHTKENPHIKIDIDKYCQKDDKSGEKQHEEEKRSSG